jgi:hypothetical protein
MKTRLTPNGPMERLSSRRLNIEELLDQALAASFPSSDPIAIARQVSAPHINAGLHPDFIEEHRYD